MSEQNNNLELEDLGYDEFFESARTNLGLSQHAVARVVSEYKEGYRVRTPSREYSAKITGRQMYEAERREDFPAVGDWVAIEVLDDSNAMIKQILPRKTILGKKYSDRQETQIIASNVDIVFVVESVDRDFNLNRLDRFVVLANEGCITPAIVLNKIDLIQETKMLNMTERVKHRFAGVDIILASSIIGNGLDDLSRHILHGRTYCFIGSSGVGKSSLINRLLGGELIKTREIGKSTGRGKHTTTSRQTYFLKNGGILIDNPGTREVGLAGAREGIDDTFDNIVLLARDCKFRDCTHTNEPGCAVLNAVRDKTLDEDRYLNFLRLRKEVEHYKMTELERRSKDRQFGKHIKKTLKQLKKYPRS